MAGWNGERVGGSADRSAEAADPGVSEIICAQIGGGVRLIVSSAFVIAGSVKSGVNRNGEAPRGSAGVVKRPGLVVLGPGKSTARASFAGAGARHTIAP